MENRIQKYQTEDYFLTEERVYISNMMYAHAHNHYEIYYLLSGEQQYFIRNRYYNIQAGDVILVPAGVLHKTTQGMGGKRILFDFSDFFLAKFLTKRSIAMLAPIFQQKVFHPSKENSQTLLGLFRNIATAQNAKNEDQVFFSLSKIFHILAESPQIPAPEEGDKRSLIDAIVAYMHAHYNSIRGLEDVAEALFVSKYHVCHTFTKYMGMSFNTYLTELRLKKACHFIAFSQKSIAEISELCGFKTPTYFCQVFKKRYHMSPTAYRKSN